MIFRRKCAAWPLAALGLVFGLLPLTAAHTQTERQRDIREPWPEDAPDQPRGIALFRAAMLRSHNEARRESGVAPLSWSPALAADAAVYARKLSRTGVFRHSAKSSRRMPEGENLWMGSQGAYAYADMVGAWTDEQRYYHDSAFPNVSTTGQWEDVGHYTQMIWHSTTQVGCGIAGNGRDEYLVCRYSPPGNVFGQYAFGTAP